MNDADTVTGVIDVVVEVLQLEDRRDEFDAQSPLFGALPELDSLAILELITRLEDRFDVVIDPEDVTAEHFETVGSLGRLIADLRR